MSPPLIREVKAHARAEGLIFVDAPPGTSCPMIEAVRDADYAVLVTEPTPFGLNDLNLAVETMYALDLPFGVVVNRAMEGRDLIRDYCKRRGLDLLAEIPDDRRVAKAYSRGEIAVRAVSGMNTLFSRLLAKVENRAAGGRRRRGKGESHVA
jgi:MinD superfamily P-loop ATPase